MTMNPIELIDRWIDERGSANVLREHLAQAKTFLEDCRFRVARLEAEIVELKAEVAALETQNAGLENVKGKLNVEIEKQKKQRSGTAESVVLRRSSRDMSGL